MSKVLPLLKDHKNVFVASDDYRAIELLRATYPDIQFYSLVRPEERGFYIKKFSWQPPQIRKQQTIRLLAYTECFCRAEYFVGTCDSNPFAFAAMRRNNQGCIDVLDRPFEGMLY